MTNPVRHLAWGPPRLQIPYFNAPIFLENKTQIGKVDEILGQINSVVRRRAGWQGAGPREPCMLDRGSSSNCIGARSSCQSWWSRSQAGLLSCMQSAGTMLRRPGRTGGCAPQCLHCPP